MSSNSPRQLNCCQASCPSQPQPFCSHWIMLFYLSLSFLLAFLPSHVMSLSSWCCLSSSSLTMVCFLVTSWRVTFLRHHLGVWVDLVWAPYPVTDWLYSYLSRVDHGPAHVNQFNLKTKIYLFFFLHFALAVPLLDVILLLSLIHIAHLCLQIWNQSVPIHNIVN